MMQWLLELGHLSNETAQMRANTCCCLVPRCANYWRLVSEALAQAKEHWRSYEKSKPRKKLKRVKDTKLLSFGDDLI